jgi:predicted RNase H-like HicB family nuclease
VVYFLLFPAEFADQIPLRHQQYSRNLRETIPYLRETFLVWHNNRSIHSINQSIMNTPNLELTAVFVEDKQKGYTAFFAQVPHIIAEGDSLEEATANLFATLKTAFKHQKTEELEGGDRCMNTNVITRSFNMILA